VRADIDGDNYAEKNLAEKYFVLRNADFLFGSLRSGCQRARQSPSGSASARPSGTLLAAGWYRPVVDGTASQH
jgi:hypothetical protein